MTVQALIQKHEELAPHEGWGKYIPEAKFTSNENIERPYYLTTVYSNFIKLFPNLTPEEALEEAYQMAAEQLGLFLKASIFTYCPITHNHGASKYIKILEHSFYLPKDFQFLRICKGLVVCKMPSWEESFGITEEIKLAKYLNIPVFYCNFGEIPIELRND